MQSRYYNPEIGRFINVDTFASTGQGLLGNNMFAYCANNPVMYTDPEGTAYALDRRTMLANAGGAIDITPLLVLLVEAVVGTLEMPKTEEREKDIAITDAKTNDSDSKAIFTPDPYDFNPRGLIRHVCVEPGKGKNGGIIKWEKPGTKIAIFEWNEDWDKGPHYHTLKIEWNNEHLGPHYPIGDEVPEPWQSLYF